MSPVNLRWIFVASALTAPVLFPANAQNPDELALGVRTSEPLAPADQQKQFQLPPGFEIQLVATEPDINKPMNLAFDATGRLWVTTSIEYPWAAPTNRPGRDRVMIFEDFGPDGRARKVTQFADGLNIPIGVYPFRTDTTGWKALVWSIPYIWLMEDTDGDGQADKRTPLYGPFDHTRDTHGNQASFRRGFDGWLYATHGFNNDSHVTARDGSHVDLNSGNTYRIRLDGSRIEQHTHGQVNPFGLAWDARGNLYSTDCHTAPIYQLLTGGWYPSFGKPHDGLGFAPVMLEHAHGSTAIDGACYYNDDLWPAEFQDTFFIGNVMTSRLNRDKITFNGSTPTATEQPDFLTSTDLWFRPVDTHLGPDGALYIADFYNRIIGHYEVPLTHPGRDRERGRIWRVIYRGTDGTPRLRSPALPTELDGLLAELASPSLARRMLATSEIQDRFGSQAVGAIEEQLKSPRNAFQRIQALWLLERLGGSTEPLAAAVTDADPLVRTHAYRILTERADGNERFEAAVRHAAQNDPDGLVRRCAVEALGAHPKIENLPLLLAIRDQVPREDTHLLYVVRKAIRDHLNREDIFAAVNTKTDFSKAQEQALTEVVIAVRSPQAATFLLNRLHTLSATSSPTLAEALQHAARYAPESGLPQLAEQIRSRYAGQFAAQFALFKSLDQGLRQRGAALPVSLRSWGIELTEQLLAQGTGPTWSYLPTSNAPTADLWDFQERQRSDGQAIRVMSSFPHGEPLTGTLRSPEFTAGPELSFWLCGHDGYPDQPAGGRNGVRLCEAGTGKVLFTATPPRNDVARRIIWDTRSVAGQRVYFEATDGDTGAAYAWLAFGDFEGGPTLPATTPRGRTEQLLNAADLANRLALTTDSPGYDKLAPFMDIMRDPAADLTLRAAALRVMVPAFRAEADWLADAQIPVVWRQRFAAGITTGDPDLKKAFVTALWKEAPHRVQVRFARLAAQDPHAVKEFALGVERGEIPAAVLRDKPLRDALLASADPTSRASLERAISSLPPADETLTQLVVDRRNAFAEAKSDVSLGARLYEQNCAVCHQLQGQGGLVGPQLTGIGNRGVERLCEDILDPNQNVDHAFRQSVITLKNGDVLAGLFRREEGDLLVFANAAGNEFSVAKGDVSERQESEQSLMPDNFGEVLSVTDFNHLLAFLLMQR